VIHKTNEKRRANCVLSVALKFRFRAKREAWLWSWTLKIRTRHYRPLSQNIVVRELDHKKQVKIYQQSGQDSCLKMFIYSYPRPKKGRALILNNSVRSNDTDIENLNALFKLLGFQVSGLSPEIDVYQHLNDTCFSDFNILFLVVLSDVQTGKKLCHFNQVSIIWKYFFFEFKLEWLSLASYASKARGVEQLMSPHSKYRLLHLTTSVRLD